MNRRMLAFVGVLMCIGALHAQLSDFVAGKDARIGVAVITDSGDTLGVNLEQPFPMLSVYKFPQALAVAEHCRSNGISLFDSIDIASVEILPDTWSPLRDKYGIRDLRLPLAELLALTMQQSDNNACDILFRFLGGPQVVDGLMAEWGFGDIRVVSTEDEMHRDVNLCYRNSSTPVAMARLVDYFDRELRKRSPEYTFIAGLMETCATGTDRLAAPLVDVEGVTVGHKTGTGDRNSRGEIIGLNDVGYIHLPVGRRYAIAVFIADSTYDLLRTAALIARISEMVYGNLPPLESGYGKDEEGCGCYEH